LVVDGGKQATPHPDQFSPLEITLVPFEYEAELAPELVWTFWRWEMSLAPDEVQTPDHPAHCLVTILTTLSGLLDKTELQKFMGDRCL